MAQPPHRLTTTGSSIQHAHSVIQHGDGAFTLKSGGHGERKLRDLLRLRAAPACHRHVQDRIPAVDVPAARMIIASLTLVLEPRPTAGAGGQARRLNVAELARAWRFVELSRPLARGAQIIRARQHAGAQEDRMEVDPPSPRPWRLCCCVGPDCMLAWASQPEPDLVLSAE